MKDVERIRLSSSAELGSLEDNSIVKRMAPQQIRKLRLQTHQQQELRVSAVRIGLRLWSNIVSAINLYFALKPRNKCEKSGHLVSPYGIVPRCYSCGVEIKSMEQLRVRAR